MTETAPPEPQSAEIQDLRQQNAELHRTIAEVRQEMTSRLVLAELKAEAVRAGIVDLDGLRLLDLSMAKIGEDNTVQGATELIEGLKTRKPYLFQASSSSVAVPPPAQPSARKMAIEMTDEEYQAARAQLLKQYSR